MIIADQSANLAVAAAVGLAGGITGNDGSSGISDQTPGPVAVQGFVGRGGVGDLAGGGWIAGSVTGNDRAGRVIFVVAHISNQTADVVTAGYVAGGVTGGSEVSLGAQSDQTANPAAGGGHVAGGVTGDDGAAFVGANQPAHVVGFSGHAGRGVAVNDQTGFQGSSHQPANAVPAGHRAGCVAVADGSVVSPDQAADVSALAGYVHGFQPHVANCAVGSGKLKQADRPMIFKADMQVTDGVVVALKDDLGSLGSKLQGQPALTVVPVGVIGVDLPVLVGVEVQVGGQLIALASGLRAAHAGHGVGEGGTVAFVLGGDADAVTVRVPADGVQLGQTGHLDEAVVVGIIIAVAGRISAECINNRGFRGFRRLHRGFRGLRGIVVILYGEGKG